MNDRAKRVTIRVETEHGALHYELTDAEYKVGAERETAGAAGGGRYTGNGSVELKASGQWVPQPVTKRIPLNELEKLEDRAVLGDRKAAEQLVDAFRAYRRAARHVEPFEGNGVEWFIKEAKRIEADPLTVEVPT